MSRAVWLAGLYDASTTLLYVRAVLDTVRAQAVQQPTSQLNVLERSVLSDTVLAYAKESTARLFGLLDHLVTTILHWIDEQAMEPGAEVLFNSQCHCATNGFSPR